MNVRVLIDGMDEIGGTTLTFSVYPGHSREGAVRALLRSTRKEVTVDATREDAASATDTVTSIEPEA